MILTQEEVTLGETSAPGGLVTRVIPGYTDGMKTAISVPDEVFHQVDAKAAELGVSRSEFFTQAARKYLAELEAQSLTNQFNEALEATGYDDSDQWAVEAGHRLLSRLAEEDPW